LSIYVQYICSQYVGLTAICRSESENYVLTSSQ
jgi:hypothetical protein